MDVAFTLVWAMTMGCVCGAPRPILHVQILLIWMNKTRNIQHYKKDKKKERKVEHKRIK